MPLLGLVRTINAKHNTICAVSLSSRMGRDLPKPVMSILCTFVSGDAIIAVLRGANQLALAE